MLARRKVELGSVTLGCGRYQLLWFLEMNCTAILRALFATHVLFSLDGCSTINRATSTVNHVHFDLGTGSYVVSNSTRDLRLWLVLLVLWNLNLRRDLTCCSIELMI